MGGGTAKIEVDGFSCGRRKVEGIDSRGINEAIATQDHICVEEVSVVISPTIEGVVAKAAVEGVAAKSACQAIITSLTGEGIGQTIAHNGVVEATTNDIVKSSGTS
ncbi:hypothetical protein MAE30S32_39330 [Microcystis aeruginosa 11-30S32]|uniref:Uncharacterized protein n=1 Tax=Microcystis aeruginosa 11-30S32 TaxID=2358142 RepID=A0A510PNI9_MICAE|nr:hypothetical protein MAE30S32_39330 [Microcystis aeruginosa 11-30S32]